MIRDEGSLKFRLESLLGWSHQAAHKGNLDAAMRAWHEITMSRWAYCKSVGFDAFQTRILIADRWASHLGHFACLDAYVKLARLGILKTKNICLVVGGDDDMVSPIGHRDKIANPVLLGLFRDVVTIRIIEGPVSETFKSLCYWLRDDLDYIRLDDDQGLDIDSAMRLAEEKWSAAGLSPLLQTTPDIDAAGTKFLNDHGISSADWFVCLHARTPGYHSNRTFRDCRIEDYELVIQRLIALGAKVIRLGDASMKPAMPVDGLIDYAVMPHKDPRVDVFLLSHCRFFIGCSSGPGAVARAFDVPTILVNHADKYRPVYKSFYFLPKLYRRIDSKQTLSIHEIPDLPSSDNPVDLMERNIEIMDNSPEQIADAVEFFFEHVIQGRPLSEEDRALQSAYDAACIEANVPGGGLIVPQFVREYPEVWHAPDPEEPRNPGEDSAELERLVGLGEIAFARGDVEAAENTFALVLKDNPVHALALNDLAIVYWKSGQPVQARCLLDRAYLAAPQDHDVVFNRGALLEELEEKESAVAMYQGYLATHDSPDIAACLAGLAAGLHGERAEC